MSYKSTTFKKIIDKINGRKILLPAIQRRFVWNHDQIEKLFDSIMRGYPIGSFLFWKVHPDAVNNYAFYEFMRDYHQRDRQFNSLAPKGFKPDESIIGVLDGQQRLSSIYIGLTGSYSYKLPYYAYNNDRAYPERKLCLNLLYQPQEESSIHFQFKFLTEDEEAECLENQYWFPVSDMLDWKEAEYNDEWFDSAIQELQESEKDGEFPNNTIASMNSQKTVIKKTLAKLFNKLHTDEVLNYFEVENDNIDDVLEVFVRVNSGGKILSKSDLLFSTIVAHWNDGRDKMENLLKSLNQKGFSFDSDFIVRACQMLALDNTPLRLEVKNLTQENVLSVKNNWEKIETSLNTTIDWLVEFGYSRDTLSSQNAVLPIALFIFNGGDKRNKNEWRRYLSHALIKNLFSSHNDRFLDELRKELKNKKSFNFDDWLDKSFISDKKFAINDDDIENMLETKKGRGAFVVLSFLYNFQHNQIGIDLDHIHPDSSFTNTKLKKLGLSETSILEWRNKKDKLPNLQMMESFKNRKKNADALKEWVDKTYQDRNEKLRFLEANYYPVSVDLEFKNFETFFEERKKNLRNKLKEIFSVK
jgi:uncharacterized protein with ParB-like and HNH nuclease domain